MTEIGAFAAKTRLSELLARAESGEEIVITKRGRPVAKLVPVEARRSAEEILQSVERIRARFKSAGFSKFDWEEWKSYRDEGRK